MKAQHKKHKNGKPYIAIKTIYTLYNINGEPNEDKECLLRFNPDGTIDFNPYSSGFTVHEVEGDIVWLNREWKLFAGNKYQFATISKAAFDAAVEAGWESD